MKKRVIIGMVCILAMGMLSACGKSIKEKEEVESVAEELGFTDEEAEAIRNDLFQDEESYEAEKQARLDAAEEQEDRIAAYDKFDAVAEWKDINPYELAVQIDDQLYVCGGTVKDIVKQIETSSIEYSYDINLDKLVKSHEREEIIVYRDDVEWFKITSFNISNENGVLADNVIISIDAEEAAYPCSRFIDGRSYDEILALSYNDVLALQDSLFTDDIWQYSEQSDSAISENEEKHDVFLEKFTLKNDFVQPSLLWTGYNVMRDSTYRFTVNCDTGIVEEFSQTGNAYFRYGETEIIQYDKLSDIKDEDLNEFISLAEETLETDFDAVTKDLETIYLFDYTGIGHSLYFSYKITKEDGSEKYAYVHFIKAGNKPIGGIGYQSIDDGERDLSEGAYIVHDSLSSELLDEMHMQVTGE